MMEYFQLTKVKHTMMKEIYLTLPIPLIIKKKIGWAQALHVYRALLTTTGMVA
jgi:hypothetical protein